MTVREERIDGRAEAAPQERSGTDRVYGIVAALALVLAAAFGISLLMGGPVDGSTPVGAVQPLTIVEPADGATAASPVALVVQTAAPLQPGPMGWSANGRHLHLRADSSELMAGVSDIAPAGSNRYRWTVQLPAGTHALRLYWSGADHQPILQGASQSVRVQVR